MIVILVAGFLGAGKTTWLLEAGRRLAASGRRVAILTNDQGGELVDTLAARAAGFAAGEVAGGCFCCRLSEFERVARELAPDVLLAEPVGSCADLVATLIGPLKAEWRVAPLTVLVDPARARDLTAPGADPDLAYLFRQQIAEADIVLLSKSDRPDRLASPVAGRPVSARTGAGVDQWLEEVLNGSAGARPLDLDYQRYAAAEALLGWVNWRLRVRTRRALTPAALIGPLLERIDLALSEAEVKIAHLKMFARSAGGYVKASVCANRQEPDVDGRLDAPPSNRHELVINLRAQGDARVLDRVVSRAMRKIEGEYVVDHREAFQPPPPQPEQRLT